MPFGSSRLASTLRIKTGERTPDGKTARLHFVNYYTFSTGRSKDPPKPAPAEGHPEHSFDLADAGAQGTGGSTLHEMTLEMYLGVESLTPKAHPRNVSTSTISEVGNGASRPRSGIR